VGSNPYPPIDDWCVPSTAVAATLASVVGAGRRGNEAGVFWLGERESTASVRAIISLRGRGVLESPGRWRVTSEVYGVVSHLAREIDLVLLATAHTHGAGVPVALSRTDREDGVRVPGLLAIVIGDAGQATVDEWSWNVYVKEFHTFDAAELARRVTFADGDITLWRANAEGAIPWSGAEDE
jgi:hypothetical protein